MRRAARVDANHAEIVNAFRRLGFSVAQTHSLGRGFPDIVVGRNGRTALVEIKAPGGGFTEEQTMFISSWRGALHVVVSIDDVLELEKKWEL